MKNATIFIRVRPETKEKVEKLAKNEKRSVTNYLETLIEKTYSTEIEKN